MAVHWKPVGSLGHAGIPDRVSRNINCLARRIRQSQHKPNHRASIITLWSVARWRCGDTEDPASLISQVEMLPRNQTNGLAFQAFSSRLCSQDGSGTLEEEAPGIVKIVEMVVVAEQNQINSPNCIRTEGRSCCLAQGVRWGLKFLAGAVKCRVSEKSKLPYP